MYVYKPRRGLKRGEENKVGCYFYSRILLTNPIQMTYRLQPLGLDLVFCDITP